MFIRNLILSTLAVAGMVNAQSNKACTQQKNQIESTADLSIIVNCTTLEGDLILGDLPTVDLPNLQQIKGSLSAENASDLTAINLGSLRSIGKEFKLNGLITLSTLNCPQLASVGSINWVKLPELKALKFTSKITQAGSVTISDTRLESLDGIDLRTASVFRVDNCKFLKSVKVGLKNVSQELDLEFNGKAVVIEFPELVWAANMTIRDATSVSCPKLQHINGTMSFEENLFQSIELPSLQAVDESLAFIGNNKLTNVSCPLLTDIGGAFKFANNTALEVVDGFPKLKSIGGALDFSGVFTKVILPALEDVMGGFHLETSNEMDCSTFDSMKGKVIQGDEYTCSTKVANPESKDGSISTGSGSGSSGNKKSSAGRKTVGSILGLSVAAIFVAVF